MVWLFLLITLPLLAALLRSAPLTLTGIGLALGMLWFVQNQGPAALVADGAVTAIAPPYVALLFGTLAIAWSTARANQTLMLWYRQSYELALRNMEEARDQRLELKQIEEDLVTSNQQLTIMSRRLQALTLAAEEAKRAKEDFVAVVSHELRTPLNMIIGFSEVIVQSPEIYGGSLPPALMADIASIRRNSAHLLELINDVLDLSQIEMGKLSIVPKWSEAAEIVHSATEVVRPLYDSKGLRLEASVPPESGSIYCDPTRIREVLVNLLSNAGRFTEAGSVIVSLEQNESEICFAVRETGPGIAPEQQAQLFEPFHQLDPTVRRDFGGSGLGLAISKRFVELHEGRMWIESEVGVGTTILFTLPRREQELAPTPQSPLRWINPYQPYVERTHRNMAPVAAPIRRIVVVEARGQVLTRLLRRRLADYEIVYEETLEAAIDALRDLPAELLLLNAPDAERQVAYFSTQFQATYGTPIIGCWTPGLHEAADRLGAMHYLVKPVSRAELLGTLDELQPGVETVLVIDDNREILQLFGRILATADPPYRVVRASSGEQALALLARRPADAIILDLIMQEMSGYQVLKSIVLDPTLRDIPVIIVSSLNPTDQHAVCDVAHISLAGGLTANALLGLLTAVQETLSPEPPSPGAINPTKSFQGEEVEVFERAAAWLLKSNGIVQ